MLDPNFTAMPAALRLIPRWVVWKGAKLPYRADAVNSMASVIDPGTWATFEQAQTAYEEGGYLGVGFVLAGDGIVGVDLDKCVEGGKPKPAALGLMDRVGCQYVELSPSGKGLRGFGYGDNIAGRRGRLDDINIEIYANRRYLTVTGRPILAGPLVPLHGFASVADAIAGPHLQKAQRVLKQSSGSSVSSVGIPRGTLPADAGQRNRCLFKLARYAKGVNPNATMSELRDLVSRWHELALPIIGTKDFSTSWGDFINGWNQVRHPYGETMQSIIDGIDFTAPLPKGVVDLGYGAHGNHLVRVCMALQAHQGDMPFFISARQAGEVLGVHFTDAAKMLTALVVDGVLTLVTKGAGQVASRYRYAWSA
jgi:hypothetical protein